MRTLYFDTATTGRWQFKLPPEHPSQPHIARLAMLVEQDDELMLDECTLIQPLLGWTYEPGAIEQHGISPSHAAQTGQPLAKVWHAFESQVRQADAMVAFNSDFHLRVLERTCLDAGAQAADNLQIECAMRAAVDLVKKPRPGTHGYAWPKLTEAYDFFTGQPLIKSLDPVDQGTRQVHAIRAIWHGINSAIPA